MAGTLKERALVTIQNLPDDATVEDILESVIFADKVNAGLSEMDAGKAIPHAEIKKMVF